MKKKVLTLIFGFLLIGVNAYSVGDLIVEGNLGIGTATPATTLDVQGNITILAGSDIRPSVDSTNALNIARADGTDWIRFDSTNKRIGIGITPDAIFEINAGSPTTNLGSTDGMGISIRNTADSALRAGIIIAEKYNTASSSVLTAALNAYAYHYGTADLTSPIGLIGGRYFAAKMASGGTISKAKGIDSNVYFNTGITGTISDAYDYYATGIDAEDGIITRAWGAYMAAHTKNTGTLTNAYGLGIAKQTAGSSSNIGIWLQGDGVGADLVMGANKETSIYSSSGELYVKDEAGNVTLISPHDPETGEWVFYSKNVKTGRVVRVDMERLVRTVEKLTGEKFMVETMGEVEQ